jgi:hypothetical protein
MKKWQPGQFKRRPITTSRINAWPGGPRTIECLGPCGRVFRSSGKDHRLCNTCNGVAPSRAATSEGEAGEVKRGGSHIHVRA